MSFSNFSGFLVLTAAPAIFAGLLSKEITEKVRAKDALNNI